MKSWFAVYFCTLPAQSCTDNIAQWAAGIGCDCLARAIAAARNAPGTALAARSAAWLVFREPFLEPLCVRYEDGLQLLLVVQLRKLMLCPVLLSPPRAMLPTETAPSPRSPPSPALPARPRQVAPPRRRHPLHQPFRPRSARRRLRLHRAELPPGRVRSTPPGNTRVLFLLRDCRSMLRMRGMRAHPANQ